VIDRFRAAGLRIGTTNYFLAGHDPNPPLGLSGSYSGATWHDGTLPAPIGDRALGFEDGGALEIFGTVPDRETRQKQFAALPANAGTVLGQGPYLVLLSPLLSPDLVGRYRAVLDAVPIP
jgi:hypothetical protein